MTILDEIIAHKRTEIDARRAKGLPTQVPGEPRGFRNSILNVEQKPALIAEVKKASPSEGVIRPDFDPVQIAKTYEEAGATCLSVLTDQKFFQGRDEYLGAVRGAVSLPLLRKDFILDQFQVEETRRLGADAVLLIVSCLHAQALKELRLRAEDIGMDALVEVHDEEEADIAASSGATFIGVNNRNLRTFTTDLSVSGRVFRHLGTGFTFVSESGLQTRNDVLGAAKMGADAVLIGTTFCREPNIETKVKELIGR